MRPILGGRLAACGLAAALVVGLIGTSGGTASAATTATATAHGIDVQLLGTTALTSGRVAASPTDPSPSANTGASLLGVLSSGVLSQAASFDPTTGDSAACAGLLGPGGAITLGASGSCTVSGVTSGVTVTLGTGTTITADAILETCTSTASGPTASLDLVGASLNGSALVATGLTPNSTVVGAGPLASITANNQSTSNGVMTASALDVNVLSALGSTSAAAVTIGRVSCGPFTAVAPTPAFPLRSLPIVAAVLAVIALGCYVARRRLLGRRTAA